MIIVSVTRSRGAIQGFSVTGHAGFKPHGEDIICAAVSMLAQTALLGLGRYIKKGLRYEIKEQNQTGPGILRCSLPDDLDEAAKIRAEAILETMVIGLKNLEENHPKYIRVLEGGGPHVQN